MAHHNKKHNNRDRNQSGKNGQNNQGKAKRQFSHTTPSIYTTPTGVNDKTPTDPDAFKAAAITTAILTARNINETHDAAAVAEALQVVQTKDTSSVRRDLRHIPFVTIDGITSRDFDDAIHAEYDTAADNPGGFIIHVAIADVAWYVRPGSALDKQAQSRGFSVYPPDRAVHMLPNELSEHACSLKPNVDRYALAVRVRIDAQGNAMDREYMRATIQSQARLTYEGVDAYIFGDKSGVPNHVQHLIAPMEAAYHALSSNALARGKLKFGFGKLSADIGNDGHVSGFYSDDNRQGSREIIEEFMCLANNVVATDLEPHAHKYPAMTREHPAPSPDQIAKASEMMNDLGLSPRGGKGWDLAQINRLMNDPAQAHRYEKIRAAAMKLINRGEYAINRNGHYGLALTHYCHFTSPIRRYPDLQIHRAMIAAFNLGEGGMAPQQNLSALFNQAANINQLDQQADAVHRIAMDRYAIAHLHRQGPVHQARLKEVKRNGTMVLTFDGTPLRVTVAQSVLPQGQYTYSPKKEILSGNNGVSYHVGDQIQVRILACNPQTGLFSIKVEQPGTPRKKGPHAPANQP